MWNEAFGQPRSLSNIPRPPSSRIRTPYFNRDQAQSAVNNIVAAGSGGGNYNNFNTHRASSTGFSSISSGDNEETASNNTDSNKVHRFLIGRSPSPRGGQKNVFSASANINNMITTTSTSRPGTATIASEFRAQSMATPVTPINKPVVLPKTYDAAEVIMGNQTPAQYVKTELDNFEALKRRHLASTNDRDSRYPDLEIQEAHLRKDKFANHQKEKDRIRVTNGRRNFKIADGYVNFRGRTYLKYLVPLESTMTKTMRWLFDLRELNVHPVTRMMREALVTTDHLSQEWLKLNVGTHKESGLNITWDALIRFVSEKILRDLYVTPAQITSWYELLCDKKGTSLDFAQAMTKLSLILPPEIDDSLSAWFTRMFFSGAYSMFRQNDNATPSEFHYIVDALETLVDNSLKRGSVTHRLRDTPSSLSSSAIDGMNNNNNSHHSHSNLGMSRSSVAKDEFSSNTPQGIMRLLAVVRADIDAYANTISTRAIRRVDDVLTMFSSESTLPRLMRCGEYQASCAKFYAMASKKLQVAKRERERAMLRTKSLLFGRGMAVDVASDD